jgi:hypothetical protein
MNVVIGRILLLATLPLSLYACSLEPEKQWYKANSNYTVADFQRDQAACTKNRVVDEDCLRGRGWVPLSGDDTKPVPRPQSPGTKGVRY